MISFDNWTCLELADNILILKGLFLTSKTVSEMKMN